MRILLAQGAAYIPSLGGASKSNRLLLEALAARGHACHAATPTHVGDAAAVRAYLEREGVPIEAATDRAIDFTRGGVHVRAFLDRGHLRSGFVRAIHECDPDWILVSSEDAGQALLQAAINTAAERVIYLARTTMAFPFGPDAAAPNARGAALLARAAGIVAVSNYVSRYFQQWSGLHAHALPISLFESGSVPDALEEGPASEGLVTIVNPCALKGIAIFLALARRMTCVRFGAVVGWGTSADEREQMAALPNVSLFEPTEDMEAIWRQTRVLLVPSLWAEAAARVVTEAMVRGIPVLASNVGGLPETKRGVDYVLPVRPITRYLPMLDDRLLPVPDVPAQDIDPWLRALEDMTMDAEAYARVSRASRIAALEHVSYTTILPFEAFLLDRCAQRASCQEG